MAGVGLLASPFHEQAVGDPTVGTQEQHPLITLDPAAIIVVRNVEPLVESAFDPPAVAVGLEPLSGVEPFGRQARHQGDFFVFPPGGLPEQARSLPREGKADVFPSQFGGGDTAIFMTSFVFPLLPRLRRSGLPEGGNPLEERSPSIQCSPAAWAGYL